MNRWPTKQLGDVAEFINGRAFEPSDWTSRGIPIIRIQNLTDPTASYNRFDGTFDQRHAVRDGDLLVSWSATLDVFVWNRGDAVLNQHIFRVVPDSTLVSKTYLFYALKSVMDELRSKTHGATMKHITKGPFERTGLPVPPLAEQERIVKLLNEAEQLRKVRAQADRHAAVLIPALFHDMFGDLETNPKGWPSKTLGKVVRIDAPMVDPRLEEYLDLPHIGPERIEEGTGQLLPTKTARQDALVSGKFLFDARHVLYSKIRPYLRKVALPNFRGLCSADVYPITPIQTEAHREYIWAVLLSDKFTKFTASHYERANIPKVNREQLNAYRCPLPPLSLQSEFAERVGEIRGLEAKQAVSRERVNALFQSMLHRAFNGDL